MSDLYFYDKYALIIDYEEVPVTTETTEESYIIYSNSVSQERVDPDLPIWSNVYNVPQEEWDNIYTDYDVQVDRTYADTIRSYKFVLSGKPTFDFFLISKKIYRALSNTEIEEFEVINIVPDNGKLYLRLKKLATLRLKKRKFIKKYHRGSLLETNIIRDDTYPVDGQKDGYWWVRKGPYTIPPPELISPENAFVLNLLNKEEEQPLYFEFRFVPREEDDQNLYHARVRLGPRSDFSDYDVYLESKEDTTGWEYFYKNEWVPFPAEGVPAGSRIRVRPEIENVKFGFLYWDAAAYNPKWCYGMNSEHRLIIVIDEADRPFIVLINGISYNPLELRISESSNGELGSIEIVLSNHNI